jgi:hypoxanthine phosphoribosyltransferase
MKPALHTPVIKVKDLQFRLFISESEIKAAIRNMAAQINSDLAGEHPVFLPVLNGAFLFAADLMREITIPNHISFIKIAYWEGTQSSGTVKSLIGAGKELKGKTVVVLEDIVDTGTSLENIVEELKNIGVNRILVACLLFKPEAYKKNLKIDYVGIQVPNVFLLGYGLDYDQEGRNLKDIYQIQNNNHV